MFVNKKDVSKEFKNSLNKEESKRYSVIVEERKNIYLKGLLFGFLIGLPIVGVSSFNHSKKTSASFTEVVYLRSLCQLIASTLVFSYFYYTLMPKKDYIILHLDTYNKRAKWLNIYKLMQKRYNLGLLMGILTFIFLSTTFCN